MKNLDFKQIWSKVKIHVAFIALFMTLAMAYCSPLFEGKVPFQDDVVQAKGMQHEIRQHLEQEGELSLWTNSMFSGMPGYQIWNPYPKNMMRYVTLIFKGGLPKPANLLFLLMIGSYICFLTLGLKPWQAVVGSIGYAFLSVNILYISAGHLNKIVAMGYLPMVVAGAILAYRKKALAGAALFGLALALQIRGNHIQIVYYTALLVGVIALFELYWQKNKVGWAKVSLFLAVGAMFAAASNASLLTASKEYMNYTIRGERLLTSEDKAEGLDLDYALSYDYKRAETFAFLVPNFFGGDETFGKDSEAVKLLQAQNPQGAQQLSNSKVYWGSSGGVFYLGIIFFYLFIYGLIYSKNTLKWALLAFIVISIPLGWGKNFISLTELMFSYFPMYNKFRDMKMIFMLTQFSMVVIAMFGIKELMTSASLKAASDGLMKRFYISTGVTAGVLLLAYIVANSSGYTSDGDPYQVYNSAQSSSLWDAIIADRAAVVKADFIRAFLFFAVSAGLIFFYLYSVVGKEAKAQWNYLLVGGLSILIFADMYMVGQRRFNDENFMSEVELNKRIGADGVDLAIQQAGAQLPNGNSQHYRVLNLSVNTFNDALTSYKHKHVGGYHAVKLRRYQDMIERHIGFRNPQVLSMLNTWFIKQAADPTNQQAFVKNTGLGNAWFVNDLKFVNTNDEEIMYVGDVVEIEPLKPEGKVIVNNRLIEGKDTISVYDAVRLSKDPDVAAKLAAEMEKKEKERDLSGFSAGIRSMQLGIQNQSVVFGTGKFQQSNKPKLAQNSVPGHIQLRRIYQFDASKTAVIKEKEFDGYLDGLTPNPGASSITLTKYSPDHMTYKATVQNGDQLAVFSETYYHDYGEGKLGWNAYIDGKPVEHIRANYVLRAMRIPEGEHTIEFKFEPKAYYTGELISLIASILLILGVGGALYLTYRDSDKKEEVA